MTEEINLEKDLSALLLEKKMLSQEQLDEAVVRQKREGGYLTKHLVELGFIQDSDLTTCLTCQYGFCYLPLTSYVISEETLHLIPEKYIFDYCVLPIEKNDRLLTVAMADPLNKGVLEQLKLATGYEIVVFISTRKELKEAISKYYGKPCKDCCLDLYQKDSMLRDDLVFDKIANGVYHGPNRRRYRRLYLPVEIEYYFYPNIVKTKALNTSMSGILFESNVSIPKGMQMATKIILNGKESISGVIEVARCESKKILNSVFGDDSHVFFFYEVGAFYTFMDEADQNKLAEFLKNKFSNTGF